VRLIVRKAFPGEVRMRLDLGRCQKLTGDLTGPSCALSLLAIVLLDPLGNLAPIDRRHFILEPDRFLLSSLPVPGRNLGIVDDQPAIALAGLSAAACYWDRRPPIRRRPIFDPPPALLWYAPGNRPTPRSTLIEGYPGRPHAARRAA
jgi:hypothetical protein